MRIFVYSSYPASKPRNPKRKEKERQGKARKDKERKIGQALVYIKKDKTKQKLNNSQPGKTLHKLLGHRHLSLRPALLIVLQHFLIEATPACGTNKMQTPWHSRVFFPVHLKTAQLSLLPLLPVAAVAVTARIRTVDSSLVGEREELIAWEALEIRPSAIVSPVRIPGYEAGTGTVAKVAWHFCYHSCPCRRRTSVVDGGRGRRRRRR